MNRRRVVTLVRVGFFVAAAIAATPFILNSLADHTVPYRVELADATGLVARNDVRLDDVIVGRVTAIELDGLVAIVDIEVDDGRALPAATTAEVRQTSLLGEQFIELRPEGTGRLARGATIPLERTSRGQELETLVELGGQLTAEVNVDNLNRVLAAADRGVGSDPTRLQRFFDASAGAANALSQSREDLGRAIEAVDTLAARLAPDTDRYGVAIDRFAAGAEALARSNHQIPAVIDQVQRLSAELSGLLERNQVSMVRAFDQIVPLLGEVVANLDDLRSVVTGLPGFNRGWSCASDGDYLNFLFPLTPELATVETNPDRCAEPEAGPNGRERDGQISVTGVTAPNLDDPLGTGNIDIGAGSANGHAGSRAASGSGMVDMLLGVVQRSGSGGQP
ncbi:MAG: MlaD family protein [Acidimicrobiales bacterium]|nr:MlaD family protein [Acidimicrobiales bacterium]